MSEAAEGLEERVSFLVPLNKLPAERQSRLLQQSEVIKLKRRQTLFKQGDRDDFTYYLITGDIEMFADDSLIKRVTGGDASSFQPLAQLQPRQMTATAKTAAQVLQVRRSLLEQLLSMDDSPPEGDGLSGMEVEEMESERSGDWLMTLLQSELFTRIPPSNIQGLLDTLETISAEVGDDIVKQGEPGDYYYAIQSGACEVVRSGSNKREIKLADLSAGATFGEEALISGAKRNATVRMTRAGELARLTKDDFTRLIKAPLLDALTREEADAAVSNGAAWLDVRFEDEHAHNGIPDSLNIPHSTLRTRIDELDPQTHYIAYCDTGGRSSAAAFLLAERGIEVSYVKGGAVNEPVPEPPAAAAPRKATTKGADTNKKSAPSATPAAPPSPSAAPPADATALPANDSNAVLEANALASSLNAEREKAQLIIEKAERMMAEAEAMKQEAERLVAAKLAEERARIDAETAKLREKLQEAQKLKDSLGDQQKAAEDEALRKEREIDERVEALEAETQARLAAEEKRLEALYQKQTEQLESLQAERESELREQLSHQLESERSKLEAEQKKRSSAQEKAAEAARQAAIEQKEAELRAQLSNELAAERTKFEQEFLRTAEELDNAREERRQALAAKEAATAEAQATIAAYKAQQQTLQAEQQAALDAERQRLKEEAARIEKLRSETIRAREAATTAKAEAEQALAAARKRQTDTSASPDLEIIEIETRASNADKELKQALKAESIINEAARDNEDELERTYDTAAEINLLLEKELNEFVGEQDDLQNSTLQREVLARQKEMVARIKARAAQQAASVEDRNQNLLDEIAAQLRKD